MQVVLLYVNLSNAYSSNPAILGQNPTRTAMFKDSQRVPHSIKDRRHLDKDLRRIRQSDFVFRFLEWCDTTRCNILATHQYPYSKS